MNFMLGYDELYDTLRKEKYSETLQQLDKKFLLDFCEYLSDLREKGGAESDLFSDSVFQSKKQLENSIGLFRGLILRRKKKLLNLVFVAAETGILKRDYENMLEFEKKVFDSLVKAFEGGDKELSGILNGSSADNKESDKMVIFSESVDEFVDMNGKVIGPFGKGELANLDVQVCEILVQGKKASFVDE
jgi:DNA replication initiation complex subunit (GINS family)